MFAFLASLLRGWWPEEPVVPLSGPTLFTVSQEVAEALVENPAAPEPKKAPPLGQVETVLFSPRGGCTKRIVREILSARKAILVSAYQMTSIPIMEALAQMARHGVRVRVIVDPSQADNIDTLLQSKVEVLADHKHAIFHDKTVIIDSHRVLTGSFNFSKNAESNNAENLVVLKGGAVGALYALNWHLHAEHSQPLMPQALPRMLLPFPGVRQHANDGEPGDETTRRPTG